jgi:hypothetical protein
VQEDIDRAREQNAQRKMEKIQSREWDSGKRNNDRSKKPQQASSTSVTMEPTDSVESKEASTDIVSKPEPTTVDVQTDASVLRDDSSKPSRTNRGRGRGRGGTGAERGAKRGSAQPSAS